MLSQIAADDTESTVGVQFAAIRSVQRCHLVLIAITLLDGCFSVIRSMGSEPTGLGSR
jgi:hypothetical protein